MKLLAFLVILMSCQQLIAAKHTSFKEFKKAHAEYTSGKLDELKAKLAKEFEGVPNMVIPDFLKTESFDEMKARLAKMPKIPLPDFAGRKATLKELKAKLEGIRKTASTMDKPDKAFFEEMKKTLRESMDPKVGPLELPELTEEEKAVLAKKKTAVVKKQADAVDVTPNRFVEDFGDEVYSRHSDAERTQKSLLASTRQAREYMVDQVYNVFGPMTFDMARATSEMMRKRNEVQDLIDWVIEVGAAEACVQEQQDNFDSINYSHGREMNRCATYAYYPARRYVNSIFYPYLEYTVSEINSLHYVVMSMINRANLARDQESLIRVLDVLVEGDQQRFDQFASEVLYWEGNAFADAHIYYLDGMRNCGQDLIDRYAMGADYIMYRLGLCPIPTKK